SLRNSVAAGEFHVAVLLRGLLEHQWPHERSLVTNLKDKPFALIGVHVGGSTVKQLKAIMDKEKLPWRSFVDLGNAGAGEIATKWNHSATPTFYVIDHKGKIRSKRAAAPGTKVMDAALEEVIGEAEKDAKKPPN